MSIILRHRYYLIDESPWPFLVSTACLFLTLNAVLFFHFFVQGLNFNSEMSELMMLSFFKNKKILNISRLSNNLVLKRNYSSQSIIDSLVLNKRVNQLDSMTQDSMCHNLIDPVTNANFSLHQMDLCLQQSFKKFGLSLGDICKEFPLSNFLVGRPSLSNLSLQLNHKYNPGVLYQRSNTLGELTCIEASKRNFNYIKDMNMNWASNMGLKLPNLTGNAKPDYACCIAWDNNIPFYYYADLKRNRLDVFERMVQNLHRNSIINTNIYWIDDVNFSETHVFQGITKTRLEKTYYGVINYYTKMNPQLARNMYLNSQYAFNKFKKTGLASDYNEIPLSTPKFIFILWITNLF